jgi:hypothetical protein
MAIIKDCFRIKTKFLIAGSRARWWPGLDGYGKSEEAELTGMRQSADAKCNPKENLNAYYDYCILKIPIDLSSRILRSLQLVGGGRE